MSCTYILCVSIFKEVLYMTERIQKWGNSQGIRISKDMLNKLGWSENESVNITETDGKLIIKRANIYQRKNIHELFDGFNSKYESVEIDWGQHSGREI